MNFNKKWPLAVMAVSLSLSLFTGCTKDTITDNSKEPSKQETQDEQKTDENVQTPQQGGNITVGMLSGIKVDLLGLEQQSQLPLSSIYRGLLQWDDSLQAVPDLASKYTVDEKAKTVTIELDKNAKWHDGTPVSAQDVIFTYATYANPYYYGKWRDGIEALDGVSQLRSFKNEVISGIKVDEATGVITMQLTEISPKIEKLLSAPLLPQHALKDKKIEDMNKLALEGKVVGNGSYQIKAASDQEVTLQKATGAAAYLDGITLKVLKNEEAEKAIQDNKVDLIQATPMLVKSIENNDNWKMIDTPGQGYHYLGINNRNDSFKDIKVRQAFGMVMDKKGYINDVLAGEGVPALTPIPPESWAYASGLKENEVSVEKAKALLTEAKWDFNKEISLRYVKDNPIWENAADFVQKQLVGAGVKVKLEPMDQDAFVAYLFSGKPYDLFLYGWKDAFDLTQLNEQWLAYEVEGMNVVGYSDAEADKQIKAAASTVNIDTRKAAYNEWQQLFVKDTPIIPIARPEQLYISNAKLHGINEKSSHALESIDQWWINK